MAAIPIRLKAFIASEARRPWQWGETDAFMFVGAWIEQTTGRNVSDGWRGRYASCEEACAMIAETLGGPIGAARDVLRRHGIERTRVPMAGDVALVIDRTPAGAAAPVAAICLGGRLRAIRTRRGIAIRNARTVLAWKMPANG